MSLPSSAREADSGGSASPSTSGRGEGGGGGGGGWGPAEKEKSALELRLALAALGLYRGWISPLLPKACRYVPSCSEYSIASYEKFGASCFVSAL